MFDIREIQNTNKNIKKNKNKKGLITFFIFS